MQAQPTLWKGGRKLSLRTQKHLIARYRDVYRTIGSLFKTYLKVDDHRMLTQKVFLVTRLFSGPDEVDPSAEPLLAPMIPAKDKDNLFNSHFSYYSCYVTKFSGQRGGAV